MSQKSYTIIIAEDDLDDQDFIKQALKETNYKVEVNSVYNGLQLMDYLLKREGYKNIAGLPDLVILDLNMPLVDGFAVLEQMKAENLLDAVPVYVLTTARSKEQHQQVIRMGARNCYSKPVSFRELRQIMEDVFDHCFNDKNKTN